MSAFTPEQQQEIANLIRRELGGSGGSINNLIRQLQTPSFDPPPGMLFPTAQDFTVIAAMDGYLPCDGVPRPIAEYQDLYDAIGSTYNYGTPPPAGQFRVPDLRQRFPLGTGSTPGFIARPMGEYGGYENSLLPSHTHTVVSGGAHSHTVTDLSGFVVGVQSSALSAGGTGVYVQSVGGTPQLYTDFSGVHSHTVNSAGGTDVGTNVPQYVVVNWIIKT